MARVATEATKVMDLQYAKSDDCQISLFFTSYFIIVPVFKNIFFSFYFSVSQ